MYLATYHIITAYAREHRLAFPQLLAVSKGATLQAMHQAYSEGCRLFGENYLQEALQKMPLLPHDCQWHMIGKVQSNKAKRITAHFDWVHSVDSYTIANRLSHYRNPDQPPLQLCIQVNIDNETSKSGCTVQDTLALAHHIHALPHVQLRGLMVIPRPGSPATSKHSFSRAAELFEHCRSSLPNAPFDTLSMGMSADWRLALTCGSTMLRLGTSIFGARPTPP